MAAVENIHGQRTSFADTLSADGNSGGNMIAACSGIAERPLDSELRRRAVVESIVSDGVMTPEELDELRKDGIGNVVID